MGKPARVNAPRIGPQAVYYGISCPQCKGIRLVVQRVRHPCPGIKRRYVMCTACNYRFRTKEVIDGPIIPYPPRKKPVTS